MRYRIIPYKSGSASAGLLARTLQALVDYKVWRGPPKAKRRVNLNWGNKEYPDDGFWWLNKPSAVTVASNKLETFKALEAAGVSHVPYTSSKETAKAWQNKGSVIFARTTGGQGGSGITIVGEGHSSDLPDRPLYTLYVKKKKEFRVHVFRGQVIDVQQKKRRNGSEADSLIRNHDNGWIFAHMDIVEPDGIRDLAIAAVRAVGLDFGAVDIIWNEKQNKCFVLEVNTAPGLTDSTAEKYANAINSL